MSEDAQCQKCNKWFSYEDLEQVGYDDNITYWCDKCKHVIDVDEEER